MAIKTFDLGCGWQVEHQLVGTTEQMTITGPDPERLRITLDTGEVRTLRKIYRDAPGRLIRLGEVFPHVRSLDQEIQSRGRKSRQKPIKR